MVGEIGIGESVAIATDTLHLVVEIGNMLRTSEHEVLKEVCEPGPLRRIVARADLVEHIKGRDGRERILMNNDTKSVFESFTFNINHQKIIYQFIIDLSRRAK